MAALKQTAGSLHTSKTVQGETSCYQTALWKLARRTDREVWRKEKWMKIVLLEQMRNTTKTISSSPCAEEDLDFDKTLPLVHVSTGSISLVWGASHLPLKSMVLLHFSQPPKCGSLLRKKECHQCHMNSTSVICVNTLRAFGKQQSLCRCDWKKPTNKQNHRMITAPRTGR